MFELLPEEILILILKKLDYNSQASLYEVCDYVKHIFMRYKIIKECNISLSTLATVKTLQTNFFKTLAPKLRKLDLSTVSDLYKTSLMPIMAKLKNLETLDVSYTNINLKDFIEIYKVCPTIKNITIQFNFGPKCPIEVPKSILLECQNVFKNIECVHFFGNQCNLMYSDIVPFILAQTSLKILQYSITEDITPVYKNIDFDSTQLHCNHFHISIPFHKKYVYIITLIPFRAIDFELYDYLIVKSEFGCSDVYGSPIFNKFFEENFVLKVNNNLEQLAINGNVCIMLWKKSSQEFDEIFFYWLHRIMKQLFVCFSYDKWSSRHILKYDRFCTVPRENETGENPTMEFGFKRKRIAPKNHVLDYDEEFRGKKELELNFVFSHALWSPITLNCSSEYLKKLTYLNLSGNVKYMATFFNTLFRSCVKLVTLNITTDNVSVSDVARSAPLSQSIKNLRVVSKMIDLNSVLTSLSQCSMLENVHLADFSSTTSTLFDPTTVIQKCENLYCLHIYNHGLTAAERLKQMRIIGDAKAKFRKTYLNFRVIKPVSHNSSDECFHLSRPYVDVFRLSQIKTIKMFY